MYKLNDIFDDINGLDNDLIIYELGLTDYQSGNRDLSNTYKWIKVSILTLIGFAVYSIFINTLIDTSSIKHQNLKLAIDDILKFGTVFIFIRLALNESLLNIEWITEVFSVLVGFIVYDFIAINIIDTHKLEKNGKISRNTKLAINDAMKFITMFIISRILIGKPFTKNWLHNITGFLIGIISYNYLLSDIFY